MKKEELSPENIEYKENFGKQLKYLRTKWAKLTTTELSKLSGLSQSYISQLENGKEPSFKTIEKLATGLAQSHVKDELKFEDIFQEPIQLYEFLLYYEVLTTRLNDQKENEFEKSVDEMISRLPIPKKNFAKYSEDIRRKLLKRKPSKKTTAKVNLSAIFSDSSTIRSTLDGVYPLDDETKKAFRLLTIGAIEKQRKKTS